MRVILITQKLDLVKSSVSADVFLKARALTELGHDVTVITTFSHLNRITRELPFKLLEEQVGNTSLLALQRFGVRLLKKYSDITDVFYLNADAFLFGAGWYRRFAKNSKPVILYLNGFSDFVEPLFRKSPVWPAGYLKKEKYAKSFFQRVKYKIRIFLERYFGTRLANTIDRFFVITSTIKKYFKAAGLFEGKMMVMSEFMDIDFLQNQAKQQNPFKEYSEGKVHLLFTGRIYIDKGADLLIEAFSRMKHGNKSVLHIVGDGEQKKELEEKVQKRGLQNNIIFHGWKSGDELLAFYQYSDIYVQPTRIPGSITNRATNEAMAVGLPIIIISDNAEEWLNDVAEVFTNGDVTSLAQAIDRLVENEDVRREKAQNARERAKNFDYRVLGKKFDEVLKDLVTG